MIKGRVLDYFTDTPVSGVNVFVLGTSTSGVLASGITSASGNWDFPSISGTDTLVNYYPSLSGHVGYSRLIERYVDNIDLYIRAQSYSSSVSTINFFNTALKTSWNLNSITTTPCNLFVTTDNGLDIIDNNTLENVNTTRISGGISALAVDRTSCDNQELYFCIPESGVFSYSLSGNFPADSILNNTLLAYEEPNILSNNVTFMDKNFNNDLALASESGIDFYPGDVSIRKFTQYPSALNNTALKLNNNGDIYYSPTNSGLYVKYSPSSDWSSPDYILDSSTTPALSGNIVNDLEIQTTSSGCTVFLATNSGITIYEENRSNISSSVFKYFDLNTISGSVVNVSSVEITPNTTLSSGVLFFSTYDEVTKSGVIQELDLLSDTIVNTFSVSSVDLKLKRAGLPISGTKNIALK